MFSQWLQSHVVFYLQDKVFNTVIAGLDKVFMSKLFYTINEIFSRQRKCIRLAGRERLTTECSPRFCTGSSSLWRWPCSPARLSSSSTRYRRYSETNYTGKALIIIWSWFRNIFNPFPLTLTCFPGRDEDCKEIRYNIIMVTFTVTSLRCLTWQFSILARVLVELSLRLLKTNSSTESAVCQNYGNSLSDMTAQIKYYRYKIKL